WRARLSFVLACRAANDCRELRRPAAGGRVRAAGKARRGLLRFPEATKDCAMPIDDKTRTELEAAVFRRLVEHLRGRTDVQNLDLMNLAGFCCNCLSNWMKDAADAKGVALSKDESRAAVYGMPYETWKSKFQGAASPGQLEAMKKSH